VARHARALGALKFQESTQMTSTLHLLDESDLKAAVPDLTSPQRFSALRAKATIRRDRWGIPHIKASDEYDLFFAQGFATAQDRLFQMDLDRLRALGRAAEYLGSGALEQDRLVRRRRMERVSKLDYEVTSSTGRLVLDAYAEGVNAFLATTRALPVEYKLLGRKPESWEPWHCIAVYKARNTAEGSFQGKLWLARLAAAVGVEKAARLSPGYLPGSLLTVPPGARSREPVLAALDELRATAAVTSMLGETDGGSNGWVIAGKHTQSGLPLLAGDPHRSLEAPNVYYQVHLIGPDFAVLGYAIPGVPMALHFCHNEHVAWGMTHANVDTQDLFVEQLRTCEGRIQYLYQDEWRPAQTTIETIRSSDRAEEQLHIIETCHGPVIAGRLEGGTGMALADPGSRDGTRWIDAVYAALKARSSDEFETALEDWTDRVNNYVHADVRGNFGYALRGRIPIRGALNGWGPVPGWTGAGEWTGYIAAACLPRSRNPRIGWVVSCNQRVVDESYPYFLTHFHAASFRAERIADRLDALKQTAEQTARKVTVADMAAIHADTTSIPAQSLQRAVARLTGLTEKAARAARLLVEWDCRLTADSCAAVLYELTAAKLTELLATCHYGSLARDLLEVADPGAAEHWRRHMKPTIFAALDRGDDSWLPRGESWASVLSTSLEFAVSHLESGFGSDESQWRWGTLHRTAQQHPLAAAFPSVAALLNPPGVETAGDSDTPLVSGARIGTDFTATFGCVGRYVHDLSAWSNGRWIVPLGASGHPGSPHYSDQQDAWARVETIPQLWDWEAIGEATETEQELTRE
jgi:penicillin amidase